LTKICLPIRNIHLLSKIDKILNFLPEFFLIFDKMLRIRILGSVIQNYGSESLRIIYYGSTGSKLGKNGTLFGTLPDGMLYSANLVLDMLLYLLYPLEADAGGIRN
jgi:hypothetical protein